MIDSFYVFVALICMPICALVCLRVGHFGAIRDIAEGNTKTLNQLEIERLKLAQKEREGR